MKVTDDMVERAHAAYWCSSVPANEPKMRAALEAALGPVDVSSVQTTHALCEVLNDEQLRVRAHLEEIARLEAQLAKAEAILGKVRDIACETDDKELYAILSGYEP